MIKDKEKLYEVLGELLYAVAKADGVVQAEEKDALKLFFKNHPWASGIEWSFEYEESKNSNIETIYKKTINYCHAYGPAPEYEEFIKAMKAIADASGGIDAEESKLIESFSADLLQRFKNDMDKLIKLEDEI